MTGSGLAARMKVIEIRRPGPADVLQLAERPVPPCGPDDVLIKVAAAGVNRADTYQRRGGYPVPAGAPEWPGLEVSGHVAAVGDRVGEFRVGDPVCALVQGGGYAEYCIAPEGQCLPVPQSVDIIEAAALPEAYFTVWSNVFEFGRLAPGERLFVHGGTSGIGVTAIQLASALGHEVFTTAGSDEKCAFCVALGAKHAFNYRTTDFARAVLEATGGRGVDVVLDMVGADYLMRNVAALAAEGRLVIIALMSGSTTPIDLYQLMAKRVHVTGSLLRPRPIEFKAAIKAKLLEHVWPLLANGRIRPIVDTIFPLEDAAKAHVRMESSEHKGKLLLQV